MKSIPFAFDDRGRQCVTYSRAAEIKGVSREIIRRHADDGRFEKIEMCGINFVTVQSLDSYARTRP